MSRAYARSSPGFLGIAMLMDKALAPQIHLFTQYYRCNNSTRQHEIDVCLQKNIENHGIDVIHVLLESEGDLEFIPDHPKLRISIESNRLTYGKWLTLSNELPCGDISVLANSDIYFDESIDLLKTEFIQQSTGRQFIALTRYNLIDNEPELHSDPHWSQDAWVVIKGEQSFGRALIQEAFFNIGYPGCDNKIAYVMHSHGYELSNPCFQLRSMHMHCDDSRPYNSRQDKLIGMHAYVHPVEYIGMTSPIDFVLLSRNKYDITKIQVNNWINNRDHYYLTGVSPNQSHITPVLIKNNDPKKLLRLKLKGQYSRISKRLSISANYLEVRKLPFECIVRTSVDLSSLGLLEQFDARFSLHEDESYYYWIDHSWATITRLPREYAPKNFQSLRNVDKFALGFACPALNDSAIEVADEPRYPDDLMFWQHPCKTEQDAWESALASSSYQTKEGEYSIYLGLPWATFIDKEKANQSSLLIIASRVKAISRYLEKHGVKLRVHTVCQHIWWYDHSDWFKQVGVTDLWISHKELGWDYLDSILLHPWHLYAVNFREPNRQIGFSNKALSERTQFASFSGAYMPHYLAETRLHIADYAKTNPEWSVTVGDMWHFNSIVYDHQIKGKKGGHADIDLSAVESFNQSLSNSIFSLCPVGAGPNTLRLWESLAMGSIPVVLSDCTELPDIEEFAPGLNLSWQDALIIYPENDLHALDEYLRSYSHERISAMRLNGHILYQLLERFSPVSKPRSSLTTPLDILADFKPQQIELDGSDMTLVTLEGERIGAMTPISEITQSLTIRFDQTEKVIGVMIEYSGDPHDGIQLDLHGHLAFDKITEIARSHQLHTRLSTIWFDATDANWFVALKVIIQSAELGSKQHRITMYPIVLKNAFSQTMKSLDLNGTLAQASEENEAAKGDLFDTARIESGEIITVLDDFVRNINPEQKKQLFPERLPTNINSLGESLADGITMYVHLMNRNGNVERNLNNWLSQNIDELILMDWSSEIPVSNIPGILVDKRVRIVRVDGQTDFIRTWAQNTATRIARNKKIFKCDSDVVFFGDFFESHPLLPGEFWVGDWHQARDFNERHLHGDVFYHIDDFERINGYDERIVSYGQDDTNFKDRLVLSGVVKNVFSFDYLHHQAHANTARAHSSKVVHPLVNTRYHRMWLAEREPWSCSSPAAFESKLLEHSDQLVRLEIANTALQVIDQTLKEKAVNLVAGWYLSSEQMASMTASEKIDEIWLRSIE